MSNVLGDADFPQYKDDLSWWQSMVLYQIYPRSFKDSTGNGVGDLKGILTKLNYLQYLGVDAIWLSPCYRSPMKDYGYDISDFCDIDPIFGSLENFDNLVAAAHGAGMRIIMDFIPNHTSDKHNWFQQSLLGGADNPYSDYYIWSDGKLDVDGQRQPPNNWVSLLDDQENPYYFNTPLSIFGGPAWTWSPDRKQYYYHQYYAEQPDLNHRNPSVKQEMLNVLRFWLDRGVDGFRVDAIATLYEIEDITQDEPENKEFKGSKDNWDSLHHIHTRHLPETRDAVTEWRAMFDEYEQQNNKEHIYMIVEIHDRTMKESTKYYITGADAPFNFNLKYVERETSAHGVHTLVQSWFNNTDPRKDWPHWVIGNHDTRRMTSRRGPGATDAFNMLLLTLPGTPTCYQGDEIGMCEPVIKEQDALDRFHRDGCRSPMQWTTGHCAGFTDAERAWLPVADNYAERNVEVQMQKRSSLQLFLDLVKLHHHPVFLKGAMYWIKITNDVMAYIRYLDNHEPYMVIMNCGQTAKADFSFILDGVKYTSGEVILHSLNITESTYQMKNMVDLSGIQTSADQALIIKCLQC